MAGLFKKAMEALGLDDGDGYGEYDYDAPPPPPARRRPDQREPIARDPRERMERIEPREQRAAADEGGTIVHPRSDPRYSAAGASDTGVVGVTSQRSPQSSASGTVRTMPAARQSSFHLAAPTQFSDVKDIGERFRSHQPVIVNLTETSREEAHRILDFASGLIYGLNGEIKKVADRVFMLTPAGYEVSADQKRELQQKGLHP